MAGLELFSLKEVQALEKFSGDDPHFDEWMFRTLAVIRDKSADWDALLSAARNETAPILLRTLKPDIQTAARNLYLLLSQRCQGKAATLCQLVADGCGFEVWRLLFMEYKPAGSEPQHAMLEAIVQPKWWNSLEHRNRVFSDVLYDWEMLISRYTQTSGEVISDSIRCATVLGYADKVLVAHLRGAQPEVRRNFAVMKASIRELLVGQQGAGSYIPHHAASTSLPTSSHMDVGEVVGAVSATCRHCGKVGHGEDSCWYSPANKAKKGSGKGKWKPEPKGKGKGGAAAASSGRFTGKCNFCKKEGHKAADCRAKAAEGKTSTTEGKVGMVEQSSDDEEDLRCMAVGFQTNDESPEGLCNEVVILDGGSDAHLAPPSFGEGLPMVESSVRLRDVQKTPIPLLGDRVTPMVLANTMAATTKFHVSETCSRPLWSVGLLYDGGFDVIISQKYGTYLGIEEKDGSYTRMEMTRVKNCFGIPAKVYSSSRDAKQALKAERIIRAVGQDESAAAADYLYEEAAAAGEEIAPPAIVEARVCEPLAEGTLGPSSRVDLLKARLKELDASQGGTKQQLWQRLYKEEQKRSRMSEDIKIAEEVHEQRIAGNGGVQVMAAPPPYVPTKLEKELHELTHTPPVPWCEACLLGQATEKPHTRLPSDIAPAKPLVQIDFGFTKAAGITAKDVDEDFATTLVGCDRDTGSILAFVTGGKTVTDYVVDRCVKFLDRVHPRKAVTVRSDTEHAPQAIIAAIVAKRETEVTHQSGKLKDSASMGQVEATIRWWRGKLKTLRYDVEMRYGRKVTPNHVLWPFLVEISAFITNAYRVRLDGHTSHFAVTGSTYKGEIIPFAETCLAKVPSSSSRQLREGRRQHKGDTTWTYGIWVGKNERNDSHKILTPEGEIEARTVRRLPADRRAVQDLFDSVCGTPWGEPLRHMPRTPKVPALATPAAPAEKEQIAIAGDPVLAASAAKGIKRGVIEVSGDGEGDDAMGQTAHGGTCAAAPAATQAIAPRTVAERPLADESEVPSAKKLRDNFVGRVTEDQTVNDPLDYSLLMELDEVDLYNKSAYPNEEVRKGKIAGFEILDEYDVIEIVPRKQSLGKAFVDTTWAIQPGKDGLKCRLVGREFKWASQRTDVFAQATSPMMTRVIDYLALKDSEPSDPLVTFVVDAICAYYQVPEDEEFYVQPPKEWLALRVAQGLDAEGVVWKLKKQLPGRRAAGAKWNEHVATKLKELGIDQYPAIPNIYARLVESRLVLDTHMDDFHGVGRQSEVNSLLPKLREAFRLKGSDAIVTGAYSHLKRVRWKFDDFTLVGASAKHVYNVVNLLGLEGANGANTPHLNEERPVDSSPIDDARASLYRTCVMTLLYADTDRPDLQGEINEMTSFLKEPSEHDWKKLIRVGRYLVKYPDLAVRLDRPQNEKDVIKLVGRCDTDWAGDKRTRRSKCCIHLLADGCLLANAARRQSFLALSSAEAEFGGIHTAAIESYAFKLLFEWLGFRVIWTVETDSAAARAMSYRLGVGKVRHLDLRLLWNQQAVKRLGLHVTKIEGPKNTADLATKVHSAVEHHRLVSDLGVVSLADFEKPLVVTVRSVQTLQGEEELAEADIETLVKIIRRVLKSVAAK
jgi:hypothetical protein